MGNLETIRDSFEMHGITNFAPKEIENTGAKLADVRLQTVVALQEVRTNFNRPFHLLKNGITTGEHISEEHPLGLAVDFTIRGKLHQVDLRVLTVLAIKAGFHGVGLYWNGTAYSFHFDLRSPERFAIWLVAKRKGEARWSISEMITGLHSRSLDPARLI